MPIVIVKVHVSIHSPVDIKTWTSIDVRVVASNREIHVFYICCLFSFSLSGALDRSSSSSIHFRLNRLHVLACFLDFLYSCIVPLIISIHSPILFDHLTCVYVWTHHNPHNPHHQRVKVQQNDHVGWCRSRLCYHQFVKHFPIQFINVCLFFLYFLILNEWITWNHQMPTPLTFNCRHGYSNLLICLPQFVWINVSLKYNDRKVNTRSFNDNDLYFRLSITFVDFKCHSL